MEKRFRILRIISLIYKVLGVIVLIVGVVLSVVLPLSAPQPAVARIAAFFASFFLSIFYALFLYGLGELVILGLAIEENTRQSVDLLRRQG
jgi:hypothetical protein